MSNLRRNTFGEKYCVHFTEFLPFSVNKDFSNFIIQAPGLKVQKQA